MDMRAVQWNLVVWNPSAGPADPHGAPRLAYIAWAVRRRWQLIVLLVGVVLLVTGLAPLHSAVVFIIGILMVAVAAPAGGASSHPTAMVRTWEYLYQRQRHGQTRNTTAARR